MLYFGGVGSGSFFSVLFQAEADVVGETYVETAGAAGEDVDVEVVFALWHFGQDNGGCGGGEADSSASLRNDKQKADSSASLRTTNKKQILCFAAE